MLVEVVGFALAGGELVEPEAGLGLVEGGLVEAVVGQGAKRTINKKDFSRTHTRRGGTTRELIQKT